VSKGIDVVVVQPRRVIPVKAEKSVPNAEALIGLMGLIEQKSERAYRAMIVFTGSTDQGGGFVRHIHWVISPSKHVYLGYRLPLMRLKAS
jgi:hypothetical protein